jgi:hypothetical protein
MLRAALAIVWGVLGAAFVLAALLALALLAGWRGLDY